MANSVLGQVLSKRGTSIDKKILAVTCMQKAINATEIYLTESNSDFKPNTDLSNFWLDAFTAMIPVNKDLAGQLRQKSKFWTNPQRWINEEGALELVPDLSELNEKCEMLLRELDNRRK